MIKVDKFGAVYSDRLVELDVSGIRVESYDGSVPCGMMRETGTTMVENALLQGVWGLSSSTCKRILASGDSMIDVGINHGDVLVLDPCAMPINGVVVVARYEGEYTVKTYYYDDNLKRLFLMPANPKYRPIEVEDLSKVEVQGVVTMVLHSPLLRRSHELRADLERQQAEGRLDIILDHTILAGYMTEQGDWSERTSNEFKALWIDRVCDELGIENKWDWASNRWGLPNLKRYLPRLLGSNRFEEIDRIIKKLTA